MDREKKLVGWRLTLAAIVLAGGLHGPSHARTLLLWDNGVQINNGFQTGVAHDSGEVAQPFMLSIPVAITGFRFVGAPDAVAGAGDTFTLRFYTDNAGAPADAPFISIDVALADTNPTPLGLFSASREATEYTLEFTGFKPGVGDYWVSVTNNDTVGEFAWAGRARIGSTNTRDTPGLGTWDLSFIALELNFSITGVPAPAVWPLLAVAGATLYARRRRRQRLGR